MGFLVRLLQGIIIMNGWRQFHDEKKCSQHKIDDNCNKYGALLAQKANKNKTGYQATQRASHRFKGIYTAHYFGYFIISIDYHAGGYR